MLCVMCSLELISKSVYRLSEEYHNNNMWGLVISNNIQYNHPGIYIFPFFNHIYPQVALPLISLGGTAGNL